MSSFEFNSQHASLEDVKRKEKYKEETGYDYDNPKQSLIKEIVDSSIQAEEMSPRGSTNDSRLLPKPGRVTYNGQTITITQQDIDAYVAAHPQVEATGNERIQITETIKAGNSSLDRGINVTPSKVNTENEGQQVNEGTPPADATTSGGNYKIRILEKNTDFILQTKAFRGQEPFNTWFSFSRDRILSISRSSASGFERDITFALQATKENDKHINSLKNITGEVKARLLDSGFNFFKEIVKSGADYKKWFQENQENIKFTIKSTEDGYNYDIRFDGEEKPEVRETPAYSTPSYPPEPSSPTHKVTKEQTPVFDSPSGSVLVSLAKDTEVIVHDSSSGPKGDMCEVTHQGAGAKNRAYIKSSDVMKKESIGETAPIDDAHEKSFAKDGEAKVWYTQKNDVPYYDSYDAKCKVNLLTEETKLNPESPADSIQQIYKDNIKKGVESILKEFGKKSDSSTVDSLIENDYYDNMARAEEYFIPTQSKAPIQVLVTIPYKHLSLIDDDPELPKHDLVREYRLSTFRNNILAVSKKMETHKAGISKFEGKVDYYDPEEESLRLLMISDILYEHLKENEIKFSEKEKDNERITIGWNRGEFAFISHEDSQQKSTNALVGMKNLKSKISISSKRTQYLLIVLDDIIKNHMELSWSDFVRKNIFYDTVSITDKTDTDPMKNGEGPIEMTKSQRAKEEGFYDDLDRRKELIKKREKERDKTQNPKRDTWDKVVAKAGTELDELYENVINNFDITRVAMAALACIKSQPINAASVDSTMQTYNKLKSDFNTLKEELSKFGDEISSIFEDPTKMKFWDDLPTDDILESWIEGIADALENLAYAAIIALVKGLLNSIGNFCGNQDAGEVGPQNIQDILPDIRPSIADIANVMLDPDTSQEDIEDLITDLASMLSIDEYCRLLAGNPSDKTISIIQDLIEKKYCKIGLNTVAKVIAFFKSLGEEGMLEELCDDEGQSNNLGPALSPWENLCPPGMDSKFQAFKTKGLSQDLIDEAMENERNKLNDLADKFLNAFQNGPLSGKSEAPPAFCSRDKDGNIVPGMTSFMDPTMQEDITTTVDMLVRPVYETFQREGQEFTKSLIGLQPVTREIKEYMNIPGVGDNIPIKKKKKMQERVPLPDLHYAYKDISCQYQQERVNNTEEDRYSRIFELPLGNATEVKDAKDSLQDIKRQGLSGEQRQQLESVERELTKAADELSSQVRFIVRDCEYTYSNSYGGQSGSDEDDSTDDSTSVSVNQENPNPEYREECEQANNFAAVSSYAFLSEKELANFAELGSGSTLVYAAQVERQQRLGGMTVPHKECGGRKLTYQIQTTEKVYSYERDIDSLSYGKLASSPYSKEEGRSRPFSFFHQALKMQFNQAWQQQALDTDLSKNFIKKIFNQQNEQLIGVMASSILNNRYTKEYRPFGYTSSTPDKQYILDFVNLGPVIASSPSSSEPSCDPHLLRLKELSDEVLDKFQEDYCAVTEDSSKEGNMNKTPIQKSIMRAAIRATLRHYLIDFFARGMFSSATFRKPERTDDLIFDYIVDKIISELLKYNVQYAHDFTRELVLLEREEFNSLDEKQVHEIFKNMLKKEYSIISPGFRNAIMIDERKTPSIQRKVYEYYSPKTIEIDSNGRFTFNDETEELISSEYNPRLIVTRMVEGDTVGSAGRSIQVEEYVGSGSIAEETVRQDFVSSMDKPMFLTCVQYEYNGKYHDMAEVQILLSEKPDIKFNMHTSLVCFVPEGAEEQNELTDFPNFNTPAPGEAKKYHTKSYEEDLSMGMIDNSESDSIKGLWRNIRRKDSTQGILNISGYIFPIHARESRGLTLEDISGSRERIEKQRLIIEDNHSTKMLYDYAFPLSDYYNAFLIHEIESNSRNQDVLMAFGETRDALYNLFYAVSPVKDYWKRNPKALENLPANLLAIFQLNFNRLLPCIDLRWNLNMFSWGNGFKGIDLSFAWKAALDTGISIFKNWVEKNDPNIILAKRLSFLASLACVNIPPSAISGLIGYPFPMNPYIYNALNLTYNALGCGTFDLSFSIGSERERAAIEEQLNGAGFKLPDYCNLEEPQETSQQNESPSEIDDYNSSESSARPSRQTYELLAALREQLAHAEERLAEFRNTDIQNYWDRQASRDRMSRYPSPGSMQDPYSIRMPVELQYVVNDNPGFEFHETNRDLQPASEVVVIPYRREFRQTFFNMRRVPGNVNIAAGEDFKRKLWILAPAELLEDAMGNWTRINDSSMPGVYYQPWNHREGPLPPSEGGVELDDFIAMSREDRDNDNLIIYRYHIEESDLDTWGEATYYLLPSARNTLRTLLNEISGLRQAIDNMNYSISR